jgi:hypothetical protein
MKQLGIFDTPLEPRSYHVTTDISAKEQIKREVRCNRQERIILEIFKKHRILSPSHAWKKWNEENDVVPITSVRRAISNLTKLGYLTKTNAMVDGLFGDREHCWKIN